MKITIIYGTTRKSITYTYVKIILNQLNAKIDSQLTEFFLPKDLPYFSNGYLLTLEDTFPYFEEYITPIMKALEESDFIILASPIYTCDESINMKLLLNILSYRWMPHRENRPSMSDKIGLVISINNGIGLYDTTKVMTNSLRFWGLKNIYKISNSESSMGLKTVDLETRRRINQEIHIKVNRILETNDDLDNIIPHKSFKSILESIKSIHRENSSNITDLNNWKNKKYLSNQKH